MNDLVNYEAYKASKQQSEDKVTTLESDHLSLVLKNTLKKKQIKTLRVWKWEKLMRK